MLVVCLELHRRLGNDVMVAATLSTLSLARLKAGDAAGAEANELEALAMFRSLGDAEGEAVGLLHLGQIAVYVGNPSAARAHLQECLRIAKDIDHHEAEGEAQLRLAEVAFEAGDLVAARLDLEKSLAICRNAGDRRGEARATFWIGRLELTSGNFGPANAYLRQAVRTLLDFEMREELLACLEDQAELISRFGGLEQAVRLSAAAQTYRDRLNLPRAVNQDDRWRRLQEALRRALPQAGHAKVWAEGAVLDLQQALAEARSRLAREP